MLQKIIKKTTRQFVAPDETLQEHSLPKRFTFEQLSPQTQLSIWRKQNHCMNKVQKENPVDQKAHG